MFRDILGPIPNLEIGYLYQFGNKIRTGRLSLDYVFPATVWDNQAVFAEAHGEFTNFWKTLQRLFKSGDTITTYNGYPERTDLSFGGGYRKLLGDSLMLGVNGFYDTTKLGSRWYGSGGLGFEMATLGAGNDLIELTFNYYGDIFQGRNSIINAFRNGPSNFDVSARYSIELGDYGPDLRLKATGYQFDIGTRRYGWNTEAEVRTRNGMFSVKAGTGHDPVNGWYHTVGGFVNVGLDFGNLLKGESPFEMPEPIFRSPRNLRRILGRKVVRRYSQPAAVIMARQFIADSFPTFPALIRWAPVAGDYQAYPPTICCVSPWPPPNIAWVFLLDGGDRRMYLSAPIAPSQVDPNGRGYVEVPFDPDAGGQRYTVRVSFLTAGDTIILTTAPVDTGWMGSGPVLLHFDLSPADIAALASAGASIAAIGVEAQTWGMSSSTTPVHVRGSQPATIVLNQ
jgi:hypothetical protein